MQYGFEREYFVRNNDGYCLVPSGIPKDECGYLVEARGEPHSDPLLAAYLLLGAEEKLRETLFGSGYILDDAETMRFPPELLQQALRAHGKPPVSIERRNLYGKDYSPRDRFQRAGLHVHFSNIRKVQGINNVPISISEFFDPIPFIKELDRVFTEEIARARRVPGMYELKSHGFEYRSLPQSTDPTE